MGLVDGVCGPDMFGPPEFEGLPFGYTQGRPSDQFDLAGEWVGKANLRLERTLGANPLLDKELKISVPTGRRCTGISGTDASP